MDALVFSRIGPSLRRFGLGLVQYAVDSYPLIQLLRLVFGIL